MVKAKNPYRVKVTIYDKDKSSCLGPFEFDCSGFSPLGSGALEIDRFIEGNKFEKTFYPSGTWKEFKVIGDLNLLMSKEPPPITPGSSKPPEKSGKAADLKAKLEKEAAEKEEGEK